MAEQYMKVKEAWKGQGNGDLTKTFIPRYAAPKPDGSGKLRNTLDKREEFILLKEGNPELGDKLQELDDLLEELLEPLEAYDRTMNEIYEEDGSEQTSEWGPRVMRCRYVLGCD
jgi:hypothetical protein